MTENDTLTTRNLTTTTPDLDVLARRAPATDNLLQLVDWLVAHGAAHLSPIARIELAERLITRRRFLIGAGALGLGVITGCGVEEEVAPTATLATRTVEHAFGTTEVPINPQRIVVAGRRGILGMLLDLGVEPIAALDASAIFGQPFHPLVADRAEELGIELIATGDSLNVPNLEQVTAVNPDLIIGIAFDIAEVADQLAQIAPTVGIEVDTAAPDLVQQIFQNVAEVVGVGDEAANQLEAFQAEIDAVAANLPNPGTVSLAQANPGEFRIYRGTDLLGQLVEDLGGQIVPTEEALPLDPLNPIYNTVSLERIDLLSGDRLIFYVGRTEELEAVYREFLDQPLVQGLPTIQTGQVLEIDTQLVFGAAGLTGLRMVLSQLETFFSS